MSIRRLTDIPGCDTCCCDRIAAIVTSAGVWLCADCQRLRERVRLCVPMGAER